MNLSEDIAISAGKYAHPSCLRTLGGGDVHDRGECPVRLVILQQERQHTHQVSSPMYVQQTQSC